MTRPQQSNDPAPAAPMTDTQRTVSAESLGIGRSRFFDKVGQGLGSILKIAAGFIIAFLAIQIFSLKMVGWQYEETSHEVQASAELKVKGAAVQVAAQKFYEDVGYLPANIEELNCRVIGFDTCTVGQKDDWFYVESHREWLAVRPFIDDEGIVAFNCETTMLMHVRNDRRFMFCAQVDTKALPTFN